MTTTQVVCDLLEIRRSLFMWKMNLAAVDRLLRHVDYDTTTLEQYDFSKVNYEGQSAGYQRVIKVDLLALLTK